MRSTARTNPTFSSIWRRISRISSASCSASPPRSARCRRGTTKLAPLYSVKRLFVQRRAVKEVKEADAAAAQRPQAGAGARDADRRRRPRISRRARASSPGNCAMPRRSRAGSTTRPRNELPLETALEYAAWATLSPEGRAQAQARAPVPGAAPARHASSGAGRDRRAPRRHDAAPARGRLAARATVLR